MMGKVAVVMAVALALVAAAVGCGGSDETSEASATIPKAKYEAQAERICTEREKEKYDQLAVAFKLARSEGKTIKDVTPADLEELTSTVVVPALQKMVEDLKALPSSDKGQAQFEKLIATREAEVDKVEADPKLFVEGKAFDKGNELAASIGIRKCILNQG
jgi:hypothetical protein